MDFEKVALVAVLASLRNPQRKTRTADDNVNTLPIIRTLIDTRYRSFLRLLVYGSGGKRRPRRPTLGLARPPRAWSCSLGGTIYDNLLIRPPQTSLDNQMRAPIITGTPALIIPL